MYVDPDHLPVIEFERNYTAFFVGEWDPTPLFLVRFAVGASVWQYCAAYNASVFRCRGDAISILGTHLENVWTNSFIV